VNGVTKLSDEDQDAAGIEAGAGLTGDRFQAL